MTSFLSRRDSLSFWSSYCERGGFGSAARFELRTRRLRLGCCMNELIAWFRLACRESTVDDLTRRLRFFGGESPNLMMSWLLFWDFLINCRVSTDLAFFGCMLREGGLDLGLVGD